MADHYELVAEMATLEQMGTQERQKLAKKRRSQQIKKWVQREKEWTTKEKQINKRNAIKSQDENNGVNPRLYTPYNENYHAKSSKYNKEKPQYNSIAKVNEVNHNNNNLNSKLNTYSSFRDRVKFEPGVMLLEAASRNDVDEVKRLFKLGVSPDSVNHDGLTALHQCCIDASVSMMTLLLKSGANVDAKDMEQWTPLHAACTCGHLNLVKRLVENGADLLAVNGDGNLPFDICEDEATLDYIEGEMVRQGITQEIIDDTRSLIGTQMLQDVQCRDSNGEDLNVVFENGATLLHIAAANGYVNVIEYLLKMDVDVNACDNDNWTALHGAACWGSAQHAKIVEMLVEAGANLDARTANDETVFDLCENLELLERLNQLKDELEMSEANSISKLKRSQSKLHTRIHSVRRTSIRDKNLTSRREAREEALLRVDSNASSSNLQVTNNNISSNHSNPKREEDCVIESNPSLHYALDKNLSFTANKNSLCQSTNGFEDSRSNKIIECQQDTLKTTQETSEPYNSSQNNDNQQNVLSIPQKAKVSPSNGNHEQSSLSRYEENSKVFSNVEKSNNFVNKHEANSGQDKKDILKEKEIMHGKINSDFDTELSPKFISEKLSDNQKSNYQAELNENNCNSSKQESWYESTVLVLSKKTIKQDEVGYQLSSMVEDLQQGNTNNSGVEYDPKYSALSSQVASINLTLADLKKHRSDLRQILASGNGSSLKFNRTTSVDSGVPAVRNHGSKQNGNMEQHLGTGGSSLNGKSISNGIPAVSSSFDCGGEPELALRKFSGDFISGSGDRPVKRDCCMLI